LKRTPPPSRVSPLRKLSLQQPEAPYTTSGSLPNPNGKTEAELVALTQRLLDAIAAGDYATYTELCDPSLTCFEPEALGGLVHGLEFHKFYFDLKRSGRTSNTTIVSAHVKLLGDNAAVVAYTRLVQSVSAETGAPQTVASEETRVWEKKSGQWVNVHFHRSAPTRK
jgi:calcium/calmodulin-dependent protein kinase (CaM kinase) II